MSVRVTSNVWEHSPQSGSSLLVLLSLADHSDDDGVCWPGINRVAYKSRLKERQTQRIINKLKEDGEIFILEQQGHLGGRGYTNLYFVTIGLSSYQIEDVLVRRFDYKPEEAQAIADEIINIQNGGDFSDTKRVSSSTPKKGVIQDTQKRVSSGVKRVSSKTKRVSSGVKKGVIAMTPEPSDNHQESSNEPSLGANAQQLDKKLNPAQEMFGALAALCKYDLAIITKKERGQLNQAECKMREKGYIPADLNAFSEWWYEYDWRGQKGQPPTLNDIRQTWGRFRDYQKNGPNGGKGNGQTRRSNIAGLQERGSDNPIKLIYDPDTNEHYYIDARTGEKVQAPS